MQIIIFNRAINASSEFANIILYCLLHIQYINPQYNVSPHATNCLMPVNCFILELNPPYIWDKDEFPSYKNPIDGTWASLLFKVESLR